MTLARMEHSGNAPPTNLQVGITAAAASIVAVSGIGYPTGAVGTFVIVIDPDLAGEEKILCSTRSINTFTVASGGRGWDGTTPSDHSSNAIIKHVWTANEADDTSDHVYNTATRDDHLQYLTIARHDITARHTFGAAFSVPGVATSSAVGDAASAGAATGPARADHTHGREAWGVGASTAIPPNTTAADGTSASPARADHVHSRAASETFSALTAASFTVSGLTGATAASRYVGATTSGAPSSGTFAAGDFVIDQTGYVWICTTAGSPGTWVSSRPPGTADAVVAISQTTTSTSYADLATVGPSVTVTTGTSAIVSVSCLMSCNVAGVGVYMSYAVSGASTIAATDVTAFEFTTPVANYGIQATMRQRISGLTAGSNIFTAKYKTGASTSAFANRYLLVEPL